MEQVRPGMVVGLQRREVQIAHTLASIVVVCDCGSPTPIVVPNFDRAGICLACKTKFVIAELHFKNDNGLVTMDTKVAKWHGPASASRALEVPAVAGG